MEEVSTKQRVVKSDASSPLLKDRFQAWMQAPIWKSRKVSKSKATNTPETLSHGQIKGVDAEGSLVNGVVALGTAQEDNLVAIEMHGNEKRVLLCGSRSKPLS
ncbi:hypothetical protein V6N13_030048 [Hibiscus sabdariffa]